MNVVVSGNELFWTDSAAGVVVAMPKTGDSPCPLPSLAIRLRQRGWMPMGDYVYWVNRDDGTVMGVASSVICSSRLSVGLVRFFSLAMVSL